MSDATEAIEADGLDLDIRSVAVIWSGPDENPRPELVLTGCTEFEAAGLLRAALKRLERDNADVIRCEFDEDEDEDDLAD